MTQQRFSRDARSPAPRDERVSAQMSRIRSKDTGPERLLRAALSAHGLRGYRLNYGKAAGRPDVAFVGRKVAVFVHGCFWHGCPHCRPPRPRHNRAFWAAKLDRNKARDARNARTLCKAGWHVVTIWACRLERFTDSAVRRVERALAASDAP